MNATLTQRDYCELLEPVLRAELPPRVRVTTHLWDSYNDHYLLYLEDIRPGHEQCVTVWPSADHISLIRVTGTDPGYRQTILPEVWLGPPQPVP